MAVHIRKKELWPVAMYAWFTVNSPTSRITTCSMHTFPQDFWVNAISNELCHLGIVANWPTNFVSGSMPYHALFVTQQVCNLLIHGSLVLENFNKIWNFSSIKSSKVVSYDKWYHDIFYWPVQKVSLYIWVQELDQLSLYLGLPH